MAGNHTRINGTGVVLSWILRLNQLETLSREFLQLARMSSSIAEQDNEHIQEAVLDIWDRRERVCGSFISQVQSLEWLWQNWETELQVLTEENHLQAVTLLEKIKSAAQTILVLDSQAKAKLSIKHKETLNGLQNLDEKEQAIRAYWPARFRGGKPSLPMTISRTT